MKRDAAVGAPSDMAGAIARTLASAEDRSVASLRRIRRDYSRTLRPLGRSFVLDVAGALTESGGPAWIAFELVHHHEQAMSQLGEEELGRFTHLLRSWGVVDAFACYLSGPAWREHQVADRLIASWAGADDRYLRRTALVSTVPLNTRARGGRGDAPRTLWVCDLLKSDADDLVIKALSWALRELAVREPEAVARYLQENGDVLAARVKREVGNKLATGLKQPSREGRA